MISRFVEFSAQFLCRWSAPSDLGYLFSTAPQQTKGPFDAKRRRQTESRGRCFRAQIRIISWAYNFGSRSVLADTGERA